MVLNEARSAGIQSLLSKAWSLLVTPRKLFGQNRLKSRFETENLRDPQKIFKFLAFEPISSCMEKMFSGEAFMFQVRDETASRLPLQLEVEYRKSYARHCQTGVLRNISLTGAFVEDTKHQFHAQDKISMTLQVSGRTRKVTAVVIWTNTDGAGVKFMPFNNQDVQIVDDLMFFVRDSRSSRRSVLNDIFSRVAS